MKLRLMVVDMLIGLSIYSNRLLADVDILIIGSTHSYSSLRFHTYQTEPLTSASRLYLEQAPQR